jgi:hypothetical protein
VAAGQHRRSGAVIGVGPSPPAVAAIQELQRLAGNRAVGPLVRRRATEGEGVPHLQRSRHPMPPTPGAQRVDGIQVFRNYGQDGDSPDIAADVEEALNNRLPRSDAEKIAMIERLLEQPDQPDAASWGKALTNLWGGFEHDLEAVASDHIGLWKRSVAEDDALTYLLVDVEGAFKTDVEHARDTYLSRNLTIVSAELERYGVGTGEDARSPEEVAEQVDTVRYIASWIQKYQSLQAQLRTIPVGYEGEPGPSAAPDSENPDPAYWESFDPGREPVDEYVFFDPEAPYLTPGVQSFLDASATAGGPPSSGLTRPAILHGSTRRGPPRVLRPPGAEGPLPPAPGGPAGPPGGQRCRAGWW